MSPSIFALTAFGQTVLTLQLMILLDGVYYPSYLPWAPIHLDLVEQKTQLFCQSSEKRGRGLMHLLAPVVPMTLQDIWFDCVCKSLLGVVLNN